MGENADLIHRFYGEILTEGNVDLVDELAGEDLVDHEEGMPGQPEGREGVKFFVRALREALPDVKAEVDITLDDGDLAAGRSIIRGTHQGELMGVPATGKPVEIKGIDIIRVEDGKVVEHWGATDMLGLMQQIGAIPE